ncbi:MAG TPA: DUF4012 domain-containing protein [Acidimicrobiia bacterium]
MVLAVFAAVVVAVVGGFVFWLQAGLIYSFTLLGTGGLGLQDHLSKAADGLTAGNYTAGEAEYRLALESTETLDRSLETPQVDFIARFQGGVTAVTNWQRVVSAADEITAATGELLSLYGDLSGNSGTQNIFTDGAIDLDRLERVAPRVDTVLDDLAQAEANLNAVQTGGRFTEPLEDVRDQALAEMAPVQTAVEVLVDIAPVLPQALGADGPRRYLIAIGNQAEMRASFGAPLTLLMVEFDDGRISIPIKGQTSTELFPPLNARVNWFGPAYNPFFLGNQRNRPFVVTNTHPNMMFSAQEMAGAWKGGNYPEVDGIVAMDLTAIAAVLEATGPIESPVYGTVTSEDIGRLLLIDAYEEFGQDDAIARQQANQQLLDELLGRILSGNDLVNSAQAIASTAPGRHFQVWMKDRRLQRLSLDAGAAGVVEAPESGDWTAMYTQNGNQSKVDVFQQRNQLVVVNLAEDGSARVRQQLTLTNATPADRPEGPPERIGYETSWLKNAYLMYVPKNARNYRVGYPQDFNVRPFAGHGRRQLGGGWIDDGLGNTMIRVVGWTPPGGQTAITVSYDLPPGTFSADAERATPATSDTSTEQQVTNEEPTSLEYRIRAEPQALFIDPTLTIQVTPPAGWGPVVQPGMQVSEGTATLSAVLDQPREIGIRFEKRS